LSYKDKLLGFTIDESKRISDSFLNFYSIIRTLRGPDGCPWDKKQTPVSLGPSLLEEVYELVDAIENSDLTNTREELGDILLVTLMIAYIYEQNESFTLPEVLQDISAKLIRRHPHVFGDVTEDDPDRVIELWNHIKKNIEKNGLEEESIFDSIPRTMPPLERSYKIQKKASKAGFDWNYIQDVFDKLHEEIDELKELLLVENEREPVKIEEEIGDVIFSVINISRFLKVDPAIALHRTNKKFLKRFAYIEKKMKEKNLELTSDNFDTMDLLWEQAKKDFMT